MFFLINLSIQILIFYCYESKFDIIDISNNERKAVQFDNSTFTVLSTETDIGEVFYEEYSFRNSVSHIFALKYSHKNYIRVGAIGWNNNPTTLLRVTNSNENIIHQTEENNYFEDYIHLDNDYSLYFNFTLNCKSTQFACKSFLYIMQSDYSEIVPLEIGKDYDLPVIESFYVLLDISSVKSDKKIIFEYSKEWYDSLESFEAQTYETTNVDTIKKKEGKYLAISDEKCKSNMCKFSVKKTTSESLRIKLTIPRDPKKYKSIKCKY